MSHCCLIYRVEGNLLILPARPCLYDRVLMSAAGVEVVTVRLVQQTVYRNGSGGSCVELNALAGESCPLAYSVILMLAGRVNMTAVGVVDNTVYSNACGCILAKNLDVGSLFREALCLDACDLYSIVRVEVLAGRRVDETTKGRRHAGADTDNDVYRGHLLYAKAVRGVVDLLGDGNIVSTLEIDVRSS